MILVVEDEMLVALGLEHTLTEAGYHVRIAGNAKEALTLLEESPFAAGILDINLGSEKSYPVADVLTARGIPFVFATAYAASGVDPRYNGARILSKPIDLATLLDVAANLVAAKS
jgi:CheY-like chemotaxis protein